jgi:hypothetical protein
VFKGSYGVKEIAEALHAIICFVFPRAFGVASGKAKKVRCVFVVGEVCCV